MTSSTLQSCVEVTALDQISGGHRFEAGARQVFSGREIAKYLQKILAWRRSRTSDLRVTNVPDYKPGPVTFKERLKSVYISQKA